MRKALIFIVTLLPLLSSGQSVRATLSDQDLLIGDHSELKVEISTNGLEIQDLLLSSLSEESGVELIDPGQPTTDQSTGRIYQTLTITSFDTSVVQVPPIGVIFKAPNGDPDTFYTNPIPMSVSTVEPDSLGLAPVKFILEEEKNWTDYLIYAWPLILVAILGLALWFWKKRKPNLEIHEDLLPSIPADEEALLALRELRNGPLLEEGKIKEFEVEISFILRRYLEKVFGFPALEATTRDITKFFQHEKWSALPLALIQETLTLSDMVKFAKVQPGVERHRQQLSHVESIIITSNIVIQEEEE